MKIGILTLPIAENYGGIIQAVALYQYLSQQGHDVTLIYKGHKKNPLKEFIKTTLRMIPCHNLFNVKTTAKLNAGLQERILLHKDFIHQEIPNISPNLITTEELKAYAHAEKFDAVIVGSDQVWRKAYINDPYYLSYFLNFVPENTKKIAYAASFGTNDWEGHGDEITIHNLLKEFSGISVREASGIDICKRRFNINNAEHVLDPTLLMDKSFYLDMIQKYDLSKISSKKMVTYVLDEEPRKKEIIQAYQNQLNISDNETLHLKGFGDSNHIHSVPEWLSAIANADFVITDSFHGMVFSIIFEKQFVVIGNEGRGLERFSSLLSSLNLENSLINSMELQLPVQDSCETNSKLEILNSLSKRFLNSALTK